MGLLCMFTPSLRRFFLSVRARYHFWGGQRAYRLGRLKKAARHFQEAISYGYESFEAYLLLGKILYREGNYPRAAIFFERAQLTEPGRYLLEGYPDDFVTTLRARKERAGRPVYRIVVETEEGGTQTRHTSPAPKVAAFGDFVDQEEHDQHLLRPPIRPGEGVDVDWDEEARKFFSN